MACPTGFRLASKIDGRRRRTVGDDFVRIMAITASGRIVMSGQQCLAMHTVGVTPRLARVTETAIDLPQRFAIVRVFGCDICVTTDATVGRMCRELQFGFIYEIGNGPARTVGFDQSFITMTIKTITVAQPGKNGRGKQSI